MATWTSAEELMLVKLYLGGTTNSRDIADKMPGKTTKQVSNKIHAMKLALAIQQTPAGAQQRATLLQRINSQKKRTLPAPTTTKPPPAKRQKRQNAPARTSSSQRAAAAHLADDATDEDEDDNNEEGEGEDAEGQHSNDNSNDNDVEMANGADSDSFAENNNNNNTAPQPEAGASKSTRAAPRSPAEPAAAVHLKKEGETSTGKQNVAPAALQSPPKQQQQQSNSGSSSTASSAPSSYSTAISNSNNGSSNIQVDIASQVDGVTATAFKDSANSRIYVLVTLPATATIHNAVYLPSVEGRLAVRLEFKRHAIAASDLRFLCADNNDNNNIEYVAGPAVDQHTTISLPVEVIRVAEIISHPEKPWLLTVVGECAGRIIPLKVGPKLE